jgi:hypothetical protein
MELEVELTDEFFHWWEGLTETEQAEVNAKVVLLQKIGPAFPARTLTSSSLPVIGI